MDEELDEGTDYANNYFDNGENYLDDEDDNLDEGGIFWWYTILSNKKRNLIELWNRDFYIFCT